MGFAPSSLLLQKPSRVWLLFLLACVVVTALLFWQQYIVQRSFHVERALLLSQRVDISAAAGSHSPSSSQNPPHTTSLADAPLHDGPAVADSHAPLQQFARDVVYDDLKPPAVNTPVANTTFMLRLPHSHTAFTDDILALPDFVAFVLSPHTDQLDTVITQARDHGHNVLLEIPIDRSPPSEGADTNSYGLYDSFTVQQNVEQLERLLSLVPHISGVYVAPHERFTHSYTNARFLLETLKKHGVGLLYPTDDAELPVLSLAQEHGYAVYSFSTVVTANLADSMVDHTLTELAPSLQQPQSHFVVFDYSPAIIRTLPLWLQGISDQGVAVSSFRATHNAL